jgi:hemolysin III
MKPRLRGWSHALAAVGALAATVALCWRCSDDPPRVASMLVYGLSMGWMFAVSATYHLGTWRPAPRRLLRALDHASIFVLIAGTYTPVAFNALAGWERPIVLGAIWTLAALGIMFSASTLRLPRWATPALYVGMGWVALVSTPSLATALPWSAVGALVGGGALYTIGALVYVRRWPDPLPRVFGFHEVFHVLVIGGAATFAAVIWIWLVPFPRA